MELAIFVRLQLPEFTTVTVELSTQKGASHEVLRLYLYE
jgi:hypothetical protein